MSNEEFKDRIRRICGVPEGAGRKANPCVVRKPTDKGYNPETRKHDRARCQHVIGARRFNRETRDESPNESNI